MLSGGSGGKGCIEPRGGKGGNGPFEESDIGGGKGAREGSAGRPLERELKEPCRLLDDDGAPLEVEAERPERLLGWPADMLALAWEEEELP